MSESQHLVHLVLLGEAFDGLEGAAVFVWNEERRYVAVNDEACRLVALPRHELVGMPVGALTDEGAAPLIEQARRTKILRGRSRVDRRDGTSVDIDWVTFRTRVAQLPYMVSVCWRRGDAAELETVAP